MIECVITRVLKDKRACYVVPIGTSRALRVSFGSAIGTGVDNRTFTEGIEGSTCWITKDVRGESYTLLHGTCSEVAKSYLQARDEVIAKGEAITIEAGDGLLDIKSNEQTLKDVLIDIKDLLNGVATTSLPFMPAPTPPIPSISIDTLFTAINPENSFSKRVVSITKKIDKLLK